MASPVSGSGAGASFDEVLVAAQDKERARLRRFRIRWIGRYVLALVVASGTLAAAVSSLFDPDRVLSALVGGWWASLLVLAIASVAVVTIPYAIVQIVAVLRAGDVAAFERTHQPWWADRAG